MKVIRWIKELLGNSMFKNVEINIAGPICSCEEENLQWSTGQNCLTIVCGTCNTQLFIPQKKFVAAFNLERGYPIRKTKKEDAKILKLVSKDPKGDQK